MNPSWYQQTTTPRLEMGGETATAWNSTPGENTPLNQFSFMAAMGGMYGADGVGNSPGSDTTWEMDKFALTLRDPYAALMAKLAKVEDGKVIIPVKDFKEEHERLLGVLKSDSRKDDRDEFAEQKAEIRQVLKQAASRRAVAAVAAGGLSLAGGGIIAKDHLGHQQEVAKARGEYRHRMLEARIQTSPSFKKLPEDQQRAILESHGSYQTALVNAAGHDPFASFYQ